MLTFGVVVISFHFICFKTLFPVSFPPSFYLVRLFFAYFVITFPFDSFAANFCVEKSQWNNQIRNASETLRRKFKKKKKWKKEHKKQFFVCYQLIWSNFVVNVENVSNSEFPFFHFFFLFSLSLLFRYFFFPLSVICLNMVFMLMRYQLPANLIPVFEGKVFFRRSLKAIERRIGTDIHFNSVN